MIIENNLKELYELITDRHDSEENAIVVDNYPYGFKRTKIRYWIETTKQGDRFVSQTLNPKTQEWNNPKKSVYNAVKVMVKEKKTGYIQNIGLYFSTDREEILNFISFIGDYPLSEQQGEQLKVLKALSKAYENITWEIKPKTHKDEVAEMLEEKQQQEVKKDINKMVNHYYKTGEF